MGSMSRGKSVHYKDFAFGGEGHSEGRVVVLLLCGVKASVLKQQHVAFVHDRDSFISFRAYAVLREGYSTAVLQ